MCSLPWKTLRRKQTQVHTCPFYSFYGRFSALFMLMHWSLYGEEISPRQLVYMGITVCIIKAPALTRGRVNRAQKKVRVQFSERSEITRCEVLCLLTRLCFLHFVTHAFAWEFLNACHVTWPAFPSSHCTLSHDLGHSPEPGSNTLVPLFKSCLLHWLAFVAFVKHVLVMLLPLLVAFTLFAFI